jgi:5-amino-6-(5-phosphoribosylamino)uracil reductase
VAERPYTLLSCALSLDGYLDSGTGERLLLSNEADLARVDGVRAGCDAILVGATTVRHDDPRLLVRSASLRAERRRSGLTETPTKVTLTRRGDLDPAAAFFTAGAPDKLVYCASGALRRTRRRIGELATVIDGGRSVDLARVSEDLHRRGVRRLMVEGGGSVHTQFLTAGLADELQLVVAPFFVGDPRASRFVGRGRFPFHPGRRATLAEVLPLGDVVLLRYGLSERFATGAEQLARPGAARG